MEAPPPLKLVIVKGPREGETLEFRSGSTVRIGRVVKGNNLTIKDPGVSSKHLIISWDSTSRNWVVQDLESSNGTFLNSSKLPLPPFQSFPLRDQDNLKLGEETSMLVHIHTVEEVVAEPGRRGRGRGRKKKVKEVVEEEDEKKEDVGVRNVRVTRSMKNLGLVLGGGNEFEIGVGRRTRAAVARKRINLPELPSEPEEEEEKEEEKEDEQCNLNRVVVKEEKVEFGSILVEEKGKVVEFGSEKGSVENKGEVVGDLEGKRNVVGFDWEHGTLGEWFDYMEVWLRKQVMDETEALIEEMSRKAERVKEYQVQMKLRKHKGVVVT